MVGLIRGVSEGLGPVGGAAMIYSLSGLLLIFTVGLPDIRRFPGRYLIAGSVLFVSYENMPGAFSRLCRHSPSGYRSRHG
ncbi:inner membrane protein YddG [Salmonella enterica subsp. enterica]|uniref:Inner membrane protein YddG n=1 Tax=Salmonella enterica I TaxID=59201 RepID=A0A447PIW8_SALET|nr:inner membrane protein YddG [Salmonella enterica subsp. enterica]